MYKDLAESWPNLWVKRSKNGKYCSFPYIRQLWNAGVQSWDDSSVWGQAHRPSFTSWQSSCLHVFSVALNDWGQALGPSAQRKQRQAKEWTQQISRSQLHPLVAAGMSVWSRRVSARARKALKGSPLSSLMQLEGLPPVTGTCFTVGLAINSVIIRAFLI